VANAISIHDEASRIFLRGLRIAVQSATVSAGLLSMKWE
jgi:hypothetical protein